MAEEILSVLAEIVLSKLGSNAVQHIGLACGVKKELSKLKETISTIRSVLSDAEEKQIKNPTIKIWLGRLKTVIYDADDLLDDITTEGLKSKVETQKSMLREVRNFFTCSNPILFRYVVGSKIKDIQASLDEIVLDMRRFKFVVKPIEMPIEIKRREETSSFVHVAKVIGRENDRECLINLLLSSTKKENVHIIPIVGMGGLGKTTLAQLLYKDYRIQQHFSKKMWVCVSDDFDVKTILIKMLQAVGDNSGTNQGIEQVINHAQKVLQDNKFFLVLDDVWNDDLVKWEKLRDLLITGASGSRIVVTTGDKKVASIVHTSTVEPYELKGLSDKQCLDILLNWAFKKGEESKYQDLVNIGREIVKKCGGVPLAARTLGAILFSKTNARDWLYIRDSEMWTLVQKDDDIIPILKLSYNQMPLYLKQCFGYCSLFEKDEHISKHKLIYGWMAHGFLQSPNRNEELEDIGEDYILELVRRSFLETKNGVSYKMHDLVHDLAQYVTVNEYMTIKEARTEAIPDRIRHVSFDKNIYCKFPTYLGEAKKLRTMFLPKRTMREFRSCVELPISNFKCLRVLEFPTHDDPIYSWRIHSLPKNVEILKHLRFLSFTMATAKLPNSLSKLSNLLYLDLGGSVFSELPRDFGNLVNLRFLLLTSQLTFLPEKSICGLSSLQTLILYGNPQLRSLGEGIQHLTGLQNLVISNCEILEFSDNDFKGLRSLKELRLFELPRLEILPEGIQDAVVSLTHMEIFKCSNLTSLSVSVLPKLQSLRIESCPNIRSLPEGRQCLAELHSLSIQDCPHLIKRCKQRVGADWLKIAHIPQIQIDGKLISKD